MTHVLYRTLSRTLFGIGLLLVVALILSGTTDMILLVIPLFCLATAALVYSELRRIRRIRQKICIRCGYDLGASKDRCPESGESFEEQREPWSERAEEDD